MDDLYLFLLLCDSSSNLFPFYVKSRFTSLRSVPAYEKAVQETFDRCLDLYLCPRVHKKRVRIKHISLDAQQNSVYILVIDI